ncbi:DUF1592 domain-containing protein [Nannocystaceae bacterium ST9]
MERRYSLGPLVLALGLTAIGCKGGGDEGADDDVGDATGSDGTGTDGTDGTGDGDGDALDPGRVTVHRLNNAEYDNTVQDLFFGVVDWRPALDFPADDHSFGFDNISDVQNLSPLHFELYERAASTMVEDALRIAPNPSLQAFEAESPDVTQTLGAEQQGFWMLWSDGEVYATFEAGDGTYRFSTRAYATQAGPDLAHLALTIDNVVVYEADVAATDPNQAEVHEVQIPVSAGLHKAAVVFTNDYYDELAMADRNLLVDSFELEGPLDPVPNPIRDLLVTCDPGAIGDQACLEQIIDEFVSRAWRRPLTQAEVEDLLGLHQIALAEGQGFEDSLHMILTAALVSPHFLFRIERDEDPGSTTPHLLDDYELAARLSYFLWSSMPDDELFALAAAGQLQDDAVLEQQVDRMLADPKAEALIDNFAGQWLYIRALDNVFKDTTNFPEFTIEMRESMRVEMREFFKTFVSEQRPLDELLTGTTTMVDDNLATIYGLDPVGPGWHEVSLDGVPRKGYLTTPGMMTVLSHPFTTSPVKRGKWVLDQILCLPPPPPPPDIEIPPPDPNSGDTVAEQLAAHRANPACAVCHDNIDPLGLAFENYDAIGKFRTLDQGQPIEPAGVLPTTDEPFADALELAELLGASPEFPACTVQKTFVYALGRGLTEADEPYLDEIELAHVEGGQRLPDLIKSIVTSEPFRMRRGETN